MIIIINHFGKNRISFKKISYNNLNLACRVQNQIFPEEDARLNFLEQIQKAPYRKEMDYYIVYFSNIPIGVTGIYSYNEYPDDAWLGWFGILEKYRSNGFGGRVLDNMGEDELIANLFRINQTKQKLIKDNVQGEKNAKKVHNLVGKEVRKTIKKLDGTMPEELLTPKKV